MAKNILILFRVAPPLQKASNMLIFLALVSGAKKKQCTFLKKVFQLTVPLFLDLVLCSILKRLELPGVIFRLHFASREVQRDRFTIHSGRPHSRKSVGTGRKIRKVQFFWKAPFCVINFYASWDMTRPSNPIVKDSKQLSQ